MKESFWKRYKIQDRIIWIFLVFLLWYLFIGDGIIALPFYLLFKVVNTSDAMSFVLSMYTITIGGAISYFLLCLLKKNRGDVLHSVLPRKGSGYMLLMGLLLGFLMNFACILCALLHGDIKLHYDFTASGIPLMVFAFISVFIQSSTEEMWTRGFMYERINVHYPLWVAIVVNGTIFGLLHLMNPGLTVLAMADLIICGLAFSLLRWYSGSLWTCFGIHTMWNFTQNLIFGLPNSGLVSEASIFKMDAMNAMSNWAYSYEFGVEGAVPAVLADLALGLGCLYLGWRAGRLHELFEKKDKPISLNFSVVDAEI